MAREKFSSSTQTGRQRVLEIAEKIVDAPLHIGEKKPVKKTRKILAEVRTKASEGNFSELSDADLKAKTDEFRAKLADGAKLDDILPEVFAVGLEAIHRKLGIDLFDVQIRGGVALHHGHIAEMKTGEGKTFVSILPAYLNALDPESKGVHIATANGYLAKRDYEMLEPVFDALGLSVGLISATERDTDKKREAYACHITYGESNEFGFDYLRDNLVSDLGNRVQRGHGFVIVDEADHVLIDEAGTPLIINGKPFTINEQLVTTCAGWAQEMTEEDGYYDVDHEKHAVALNDKGIDFVMNKLGMAGTEGEKLPVAYVRDGVEHFQDKFFQTQNTELYGYIRDALKAKEFYKKDKNYIVRDADGDGGGEVVIISKYTGRLLQGRRFAERLHQAIEAKEGVEIRAESMLDGVTTVQKYFSLYDKLSGMSGTALTSARELNKIYDVHVVPIDTNVDIKRKDNLDLIFKSEQAKIDFVIEEILERHANGQPILVCTADVAESERIADLLKGRGIGDDEFNVLNAKQDKLAEEARIIAQAGKKGAITISTNMAGRGVDIMLGGVKPPAGSPDMEAWERANQEVIDLKGLYVLGVGRYDSRRLNDQARGRAGRQGDPGETQFVVSLDDPLLAKNQHLASLIKMAKAKLPDHYPLTNEWLRNLVERAQTIKEDEAVEIRKYLYKYDEVLDKQREAVYKYRDRLLNNDNLHGLTQDILDDFVDLEISDAMQDGKIDLEKLWRAAKRLYDFDFSVEEFKELMGGNITDTPLVTTFLQDRFKKYLSDAYEKRYTQSKRLIDTQTEHDGEELMDKYERTILLRALDSKWIEQLYDMEYLREGIEYRVYVQAKPETEYGREGYKMFAGIVDEMKKEIAFNLFHTRIEFR